MQAVLTSDSPALVGSTLTFVVDLVFPRCQEEDASGNIIYENYRNDTGPPADPYVYNWTAWAEDGDWGNDSGQSHHNVFPDGKPFPTPTPTPTPIPAPIPTPTPTPTPTGGRNGILSTSFTH